MPDYPELLRLIVGRIVAHPDQVRVEEERSGTHVLLRVHAHPEDLGKLIGREGRHIEAIRMVVRAASLRPRERVNIEVAD